MSNIITPGFDQIALLTQTIVPSNTNNLVVNIPTNSYQFIEIDAILYDASAAAGDQTLFVRFNGLSTNIYRYMTEHNINGVLSNVVPAAASGQFALASYGSSNGGYGINHFKARLVRLPVNLGHLVELENKSLGAAANITKDVLTGQLDLNANISSISFIIATLNIGLGSVVNVWGRGK